MRYVRHQFIVFGALPCLVASIEEAQDIQFSLMKRSQDRKQSSKRDGAFWWKFSFQSQKAGNSYEKENIRKKEFLKEELLFLKEGGNEKYDYKRMNTKITQSHFLWQLPSLLPIIVTNLLYTLRLKRYIGCQSHARILEQVTQVNWFDWIKKPSQSVQISLTRRRIGRRKEEKNGGTTLWTMGTNIIQMSHKFVFFFGEM